MHGSVEGVLGDWHSYSDFGFLSASVRASALVGQSGLGLEAASCAQERGGGAVG